MNKRKECESAEHRGAPAMMMLVNELSRFFRREMRKVCEENGVPLGYRSLLFHLARNNGCNQKLLSERTGLKPSTVSITVEKMERDGYVRRERNCLDSRAVNVFLTEKGLDIDRKNKEKVDQLERQFEENITNEERRTVVVILEKVMRGYCESQNFSCPACISKDGEEEDESNKEQVP